MVHKIAFTWLEFPSGYIYLSIMPRGSCSRDTFKHKEKACEIAFCFVHLFIDELCIYFTFQNVQPEKK